MNISVQDYHSGKYLIPPIRNTLNIQGGLQPFSENENLF